MIKQLATPGVYVTEVDSFSSSVIAVPTGIPVFLGYTAVASKVNYPLRISSLSEYISIFGAAPHIEYDYQSNTRATPQYQANKAAPAFGLYFGLELFFNNGGGVCYVLSLGTYDEVIAAGAFSKDVYTNALPIATECAEADLLVMPDAVHLRQQDWVSVSQLALQSFQFCSSLSELETFDLATPNVSAISSACMGQPTIYNRACIWLTVRLTPHKVPISPQCRINFCLTGVSSMSTV